jgi:hypothetical protein
MEACEAPTVLQSRGSSGAQCSNSDCYDATTKPHALQTTPAACTCCMSDARCYSTCLTMHVHKASTQTPLCSLKSNTKENLNAMSGSVGDISKRHIWSRASNAGSVAIARLTKKHKPCTHAGNTGHTYASVTQPPFLR